MNNVFPSGICSASQNVSNVEEGAARTSQHPYNKQHPNVQNFNENFNLEAEARFLSAFFVCNEAVCIGVDLLTENCFYKNAHRYIFRAVGELFLADTEVDVITLSEHLLTMGLLEQAGGKVYLNELDGLVLDYNHLRNHARVIFELSQLRELMLSCHQILNRCHERDMSIPEILDWSEHKIFSLSDKQNDNSLSHISTITPEVKDEIESVFEHKGSTYGLATGFRPLDSKFGGLRKGQLVILAARPGVGKSSLALNIAYNSAVVHKKKVAIFSMEMSKSELAMRFISSGCEIDLEVLMTGFGCNEVHLRAAHEMADRLAMSDIFIDDKGCVSPAEIKTKCRRLKSEHRGLDLIIVD